MFLELIPGLDAFVFKKAACGAHHTLAINEWGLLFSWGSNADGQLGNVNISDKYVSHCLQTLFFHSAFQSLIVGLNSKNAIECTPRMVKTPGAGVVVQIACGAKHALALTNNGELYSWGCNSEGQLGLGSI